MKKVSYLLIFLVTFLSFNVVSLAAGSASLSVSSSTIENGNSVTASVTIANTAAWNITISSSGATSGCTQKFADASSTGNNVTKTFSVTCKSTSTGIIYFTMSGDITSSDGVNTRISGSKSVNVVTPRAKSANNKLSSLSVNGYDISPTFDSNTNNYSVNVPSTVDSVTINATKADSYASLNGTGTVSVSEGTNIFDIVVTSETGVSNTYKLTINVEDLNPIEVDLNGKKYTVVKEIKNLTKPNLFDETTIKINDFDIPAFINETDNMTLVGLKDSEGNINLYIYNDGNYTLYNQYLFDQLTIYVLSDENIDVPNGYNKTTIKIGDNEVTAYKSDKYNFPLIYAINLATGKKDLYKYDASENTIQKYEPIYIDTSVENLYFDIIVGLLGLIAISYIAFILILSSSKKKNIEKAKAKIESKELPEEEKKEILKTMSIDIGGIKAEVKKNNQEKKISKKELKKQKRLEKKQKEEEETLKLEQEEALKQKIILEEKNRKKELKKQKKLDKKNNSNDDMARF